MRPFRATLAFLIALPIQAQQPGRLGDQELRDLMEMLNTPVVSASRQEERLSDAPATVIVISRRDIQVRGYTRFYEILDDLPGYDQMLVYGDTFVKPYTRGFRNEIGESVLLMIDGQVQNHLWYNTIDDPLATMPMSNIKQVEVVYGPASAVYGANAFMGVINVITEAGSGGSPYTLQADLIGGSLNQRGFDVTFTQSRGDWRYSLTSRIYHGDIDGDAANRYVYTSGKRFLDPTGWGRTIFGTMLDRYGVEAISPYTAKAFDLRVGTREWEFGIQHSGVRSGYGFLWSWDHYIPNANTWEQPEWSFFARMDHAFSDVLNTRASARYRTSQTANDSMDFEVDYVSQGDFDQGKFNILTGQWVGPGFYVLPEHWGVATSTFTYTQDFSWKPSSFLSMNWGITFSEEIQQLKYNFNQGDDLYLFRSDRFDTGLLGQYFPKKPQNLGDSNHARFLRRGGYLQGRMNFTENHGLVLGVRNDWHSGFGDANTIRAGYVGKWGGFVAKALYGQAYHEPVWRSLGGGWRGSASSLSLKPQRTHTMEVSLGYTEKHWSLSGNAYRIRNTGVIVGDINVGIMDITGVDLQAHLLMKLAGKEQKLWLYATKLFKQTSDPYFPSVNVRDSNEVPDIAKHQIHLGWTSTFAKDMTLTLRARLFSARSTVATNPVGRIPAYEVVDAYFQTGLLAEGLSAGLKVTNLLDKAYDQPGMRRGSAGVTPPSFVGGNYVGSGGYNTSLLPQAGRAFEVMLRYRY